MSLAVSLTATKSMCGFDARTVSCMASPRSFPSHRASSKDMTPAAQSAVDFLNDVSAMTEARSTTSGFAARSLSTPASPAMNLTGWPSLTKVEGAGDSPRRQARQDRGANHHLQNLVLLRPVVLDACKPHDGHDQRAKLHEDGLSGARRVAAARCWNSAASQPRCYAGPPRTTCQILMQKQMATEFVYEI